MNAGRICCVVLLGSGGIAGMAATPGSTGAQGLKPGLWEVTSKTNGGGTPVELAIRAMQEKLAALAPAHRKTIDDMLAHGGVRLAPPTPNGGVTLQVCMTPGMVERNEFPLQPGGNCKTTRQQRSGNVLSLNFACTNPPATAEARVVFNGPLRYALHATVDAPSAGQAQKIAIEGSGRWLADSCGDLRPLGERTP